MSTKQISGRVMLKGKHIILGVTGGIAAYKTAGLVRELVRAGAEVQVVMTENAAQFVTPLTLSTLSRREVVTGMFSPSSGQQGTKHIDLALWADLMLIAPATANTIAKIAGGFADDFLSTLVLALRCPLALAPSMDADMFLNERTQRNIDALKEEGCFVIPPETGELASGLSGPGRLPEVEGLITFVENTLDGAHQDLKGRAVLVTAGPTQEPIDPVRYVGNRSSGKMGFAIAAAAALRGAEVTLISGPVALRTPRSVHRVDVRTACEMLDAVQGAYTLSDLVVMAAAVADFAPSHPADQKLKRDAQPGETLTLSLKKNPDILKLLGEQKTVQVLVGFALETGNGLDNARKKLTGKNLDAIIFNNAQEEGAGFEGDTNIVTILMADGKIEQLPKLLKFDVANEILNRIVPLLK